MDASDLIRPIKMESDDIRVLSMMQQLKTNPSWIYFSDKLRADLNIILEGIKTPIDITTIDPALAITILATQETNKMLAAQLEGILNLPDITIAEIRQKYENEQDKLDGAGTNTTSIF